MSSNLRAHFSASHGLVQVPPHGVSIGRAPAERAAEPFADSGVGMPIMPDPSSIQTTDNPQAAGADARRGMGVGQQGSSMAGKLAQGIDWLRGMTDLKMSTPTSTMAPPTTSLMRERAKLRVGTGDGMDASSVRGDLGSQEDRDRLLLTGDHSGRADPARGMPPTVASEAREGEFGVECPVCGDVLLSRKMVTLNRMLDEHVREDHPRLLEPSLRS